MGSNNIHQGHNERTIAEVRLLIISNMEALSLMAGDQRNKIKAVDCFDI